MIEIVLDVRPRTRRAGSCFDAFPTPNRRPLRLETLRDASRPHQRADMSGDAGGEIVRPIAALEH